MKLNFWQWLGLILVVLAGLGLYLYKSSTNQSAPVTSQPA